MQEAINTFRPRSETRIIEKIEGQIDSRLSTNRLRDLTIAEEQTHAAEILALVTGRAIIPREYTLEDYDLYSEDGDTLRQILDDGIVDSEAQIIEGKPGASKELQRRKIERANLDHITSLPVGFALIESSAADLTWTKEERRAQGYPDHTMVRLTARLSPSTFKQLNIILQTSDLSIINRCRRMIEPGVSDILSSEELLKSPQIVGVSDSDIESLARVIETEYVRSTMSFSASGLAKTALGRVVMKRKIAKELAKTNSWEYVVSQPDVFNVLFDSFVSASMLDRDDWFNAAAVVRGGAWYKLIERFEGRDKTNTIVDPEELRRSAQCAATAGIAFTGCGGTIEMKSVLGGSSFMDRMFESATLMNTRAGRGCCASCGASGDLYGCGAFCQGCNKIWCEEYVLSGGQLEAKEVKCRIRTKAKQEKYYKYARAT